MITHVLAIASNYLEIVDVKDKANPTHCGLLYLGDHLLMDLTVIGSVCYVVGNSRLFAVDISDLANPSLSYTMVDGDSGVELAGVRRIASYENRVYITGDTGGNNSGYLQVLDISTTPPTVEGIDTNVQQATMVNSMEIANQGGTLFLFISGLLIAPPFDSDYGYIARWNINNPLAPAWAAQQQLRQHANNGWKSSKIKGDYIATSDWAFGYQERWNISVGIVASGQFQNNPVNLTGVALSDDTDYLLPIYDDGLYSNDFTTPGVPANLDIVVDGAEGGLVQLDDPVHAIVEGNDMFIASEASDCIQIMDITTKANVVYKGRINNGDGGAQLNAVARIALEDFTQNADFVGTPRRGIEQLTVEFTDLSTSVLPIQRWTWDFGDGQGSSEQNPTHTYNGKGRYTVSLTVE